MNTINLIASYGWPALVALIVGAILALDDDAASDGARAKAALAYSAIPAALFYIALATRG